MASGAERRVAVVVVTYNSADVIGELLRSIPDGYPGRELPVIVVDNGSSDGTRELLSAHPEVQLLEQGNTGYAHGVNRGVAAVGDGYDVLILNADVRLLPGSVDVLLEQFRACDDAGIVVPRVVDPAGEVAPSLRRRPTAPRTFLEACVGGARAGRYGERFRPKGDDPQDVDWATGAAMLVRAEAWAQLGPLSEAFFLYSEETEYCLRAKSAGWRVVCEPAAAVMHVGGDMATSDRLWALRAVNRVRLHRDRHGRLRGFGMRVATLAFESRRVLGGQRPSRLAVRCLLRGDLDRSAVELVRSLAGDSEPLLRSHPGARLE